MLFERSHARSGRSHPLHEQVEQGASWSDHELWQRAGEPVPAPISAAVGRDPAGIEQAPAAAQVVPVDIADDRPAAPRLRRRREIGRSLFNTFDTARRRSQGGTTIRMTGF